MANKKESLSVNLSKLILTVFIIVSLGALVGAIGYLASHLRQANAPIINPATDFRCAQKAKFSGNCEIIATGFEFDSGLKKCVKNTGSCYVETPFKTLEECQKTCETGAISGDEMNILR